MEEIINMQEQIHFMHDKKIIIDWQPSTKLT